MAAFEFYNSVFITLLIIQCSLSLPVTYNTTNPSALNEEDVLRTGHNEFMQRYAERAVNAARLIFKDSTVTVNHNEEVEIFKKNLTDLISEYEAVKTPEGYGQIVEHFGKLNEYYLETALEKSTTDMKFIKRILEKYECDKIAEEIKKKMAEFMEEFIKALAIAMMG